MNVICSSFGKDSFATIIIAHYLGIEIDKVIYCKIMFDSEISAEVPEHERFINEVAKPKVEKDFGYPVETVVADKTYIDGFMKPISKGPRCGMLTGSPLCRGCWVQRDLKVRPMERHMRSLGPGVISYVGIAKDEDQRLARLTETRVSLLEREGFTKKDTRNICASVDLLSPVYEFAPRNGCFFCPNAKPPELAHLRKHHPELWGRMLELEATPGVVRKKYNRDLFLSDMEWNFQVDDSQLSLF